MVLDPHPEATHQLLVPAPHIHVAAPIFIAVSAMEPRRELLGRIAVELHLQLGIIVCSTSRPARQN